MSQTVSTSFQNVQVSGEDLRLLPQKAIYWKKHKCLLIADLHIGKVGHFRKNNIAIPQEAAEINFQKLERLLLDYQPKKVYFLGDLFHSFYNKEWEQLIFLLAKYRKISFILITGNHDILQADNYKNAGISCFDKVSLGPFILTHHPEDHEGHYNLCGHIHPGIHLRGEAKQYLRLPCFYFGQERGILPAFGSFTGTAALKACTGDLIYAITSDTVIPIDTK